MPTIYEECILMTRNDHLEIEKEGARTPAQAANDSPPTKVDLKIAEVETRLIRKRALVFLRALDNRLDAIVRGEIPPMPTLERPLPEILRAR